MVKPVTPPQSQSLDPRLYCDYARLVKLQAQSQSFTLLPQLKAGSALSGRHQSTFRGRGLNFEELRHYQLGDDIRNLDWKVTLRTGKPHVRSYTEEKDRNVVIVVDQRSSMFFSSVEVMKSVVAAEVAALCGWRVLKDSDRVGFLIAGNNGLNWSKAKRSQNDLLARLKLLSNINQELNVHSVSDSTPTFSQIVSLLNRLKLRACTLVFISDWSDAEQSDVDLLKQLQQHNDLLAVKISDPFEQKLPDEAADRGWVMGDGTYQLSVNEAAALNQVNQHFRHKHGHIQQQLSKMMRAHHIPLVELDTSGEHLTQFKKMVGGR
ncbi:DUF58 domain-containing protein [Vibrio sp. SCSIO 43135]|uniref:DUF58 domain-containing protein n=1 Tax=Vibrio sp. SCSIO 43135 TaxID=2819096 RepID=UPI002075B93A|nr:DUF58 domain-containing protein [Vibrio sp. SCSIO 43135]USD42703.1 DUF58 domain-containing protein [Vibrio sp. SCSIO 43135]